MIFVSLAKRLGLVLKALRRMFVVDAGLLLPVRYERPLASIGRYTSVGHFTSAKYRISGGITVEINIDVDYYSAPQ